MIGHFFDDVLLIFIMELSVSLMIYGFSKKADNLLNIETMDNFMTTLSTPYQQG
ncbi:hypothetical protein [Bartonella machadoae]|uniref:hypothetical protein n=1 Tax=Bartonella machadoae TaxID=2893471 RepID=UPI001F4CC3C3|nr:hypothetical protein [Bartonella machadoae]UNE54762.1 hypothetical protein LNM86_02460 [Bartonella machadoae]